MNVTLTGDPYSDVAVVVTKPLTNQERGHLNCFPHSMGWLLENFEVQVVIKPRKEFRRVKWTHL